MWGSTAILATAQSVEGCENSEHANVCGVCVCVCICVRASNILECMYVCVLCVRVRVCMCINSSVFVCLRARARSSRRVVFCDCACTDETL